MTVDYLTVVGTLFLVKGGSINEKEDYLFNDNLDYLAANDPSIWLCCTCSHTGTRSYPFSSPCSRTTSTSYTSSDSCADTSSSATAANNRTRRVS